MDDCRAGPEHPLVFIQAAVRRKHILWTHHVNMRLRGRSISRQEILDAVDSYEIVEEYPDDKYLPSYLVLAQCGTKAFHILFAADVEDENVRVVTAYRPDTRSWLPDLKTRRRNS